MVDYKTVKDDLNDIRFFYARKDIFEAGSHSIGENDGIINKVNMYNELVRKAPARLYEMYISMYLQNNTLESLAEEVGLSYVSVQRTNGQLIKYLKKEINKEEK